MEENSSRWKKWMFQVNKGSIAVIVVGTLLNILGNRLSAVVSIPFRLDCIGTFLAAVLYGPAAGAISGALMNIILTFWERDFIWFGLVSIAGAVVAGRLFPKDRKLESFSVIATALTAGLVMIVVSVPLNMIFKGGYTGNEWGDALVVLLQPYIKVSLIRCFIGCVLVDMPDKALSIVIVMLIIYIYRKFRANRREASTSSVVALLLCVASGVFFIGFGGAAVQAAENSEWDTSFMSTIYGKEDGLVSVEINTIAQTKDGYVWAGAYSGLYRYNGLEFKQMQIDDRISNVIELFEDSAGRLWIGTNDSGVFCYDPETEEVAGYSVSDGLSTNSIRSICEDGEGRIYVGTADALCRIERDGSIFVYSDFSEISCVYSLQCVGDEGIAGVTHRLPA